MLDFTNTIIQKITAHRIGNKIAEEALIASNTELSYSSTGINEILQRYFLSPFSSEEYFSFNSFDSENAPNPLIEIAKNIFEDINTFYDNSALIASTLYDKIQDEKIKSGDLFVVAFSDIIIDDEITNAIGIFKSENKHAFVKLDVENDNFTLRFDEAINVDKLDRGCLIFNTFKEDGFKISLVDKSGKGIDAKFWKETFLNLKPINNEFYKTNEFLKITKNFVTKHIPEDIEVERTEQIDMLNRSIDYFNENETFNKEEFENEVFQEPKMIESFRQFDETYRQKNSLSFEDDFDISEQAVKKQSRVFNNVLKLDKNFHIYIHGNSELVKRGEEKDGRKFYKFYFENES